MNQRRRRAAIPTIALAIILVLAACGGGRGESAEERAAVVAMLERDGNSRGLAECMADEMDGAYSADELEEYVVAGSNVSTVNFELIEAVSVAKIACTGK